MLGARATRRGRGAARRGARGRGRDERALGFYGYGYGYGGGGAPSSSSTTFSPRARGVARGSVGGEDETGGVGAGDGDDGGADGEDGPGDGVEQFGVHDSEEKRAARARRARALIGHRNRARANASGGVRREGRGTEWIF